MKRTILFSLISISLSAPALACDASTNCLQAQVTKNKNSIDATTKSVDVLRSNTQKSLDNALAYSNKIESRALTNTKTISAVSQRVTVNTNDISSLKVNKVDKSTFETDSRRQDAALSDETFARIEGDKRNDKAIGTMMTDISIAQATGDYANSRVDAANYNIEINRQALANTNARVSQNTADIARHDNQIAGLQQQVNSNYTSLRNQIQDVKKRADAGIAGISAMSNIPQVTESGRFSLGAGVGTHGSQQALAVGASSRLSQNVIGKMSVAADTQSKWSTGVGIAYQW